MNAYAASQPPSNTLISTLLPLALHLIAALAAWKVLVKAGQPGWLALIPLANVFMLYKIAWGSGWYALLMLVPFVNFIVALMQPF